jgi:hypothetical protein
MRLVRNQPEIVLTGDRGDPSTSLRLRTPPVQVVRRVDEDGARARRDFRFELVEGRTAIQASCGGQARARPWRRRRSPRMAPLRVRHDDLVSRLERRTEQEVQRVDASVRDHDLVRRSIGVPFTRRSFSARLEAALPIRSSGHVCVRLSIDGGSHRRFQRLRRTSKLTSPDPAKRIPHAGHHVADADGARTAESSGRTFGDVRQVPGFRVLEVPRGSEVHGRGSRFLL